VRCGFRCIAISKCCNQSRSIHLLTRFCRLLSLAFRYHGNLTRTGSFSQKKALFRSQKAQSRGDGGGLRDGGGFENEHFEHGREAFKTAYDDPLASEVQREYEQEKQQHEAKKKNMLKHQMASYASAPTIGKAIARNKILRRKQGSTAKACCYKGCTRMHRYADGYCNMHANNAKSMGKSSSHGKNSTKSSSKRQVPLQHASSASPAVLSASWKAPILEGGGWKSHNASKATEELSFMGGSRKAAPQGQPPGGIPTYNTPPSGAPPRGPFPSSTGDSSAWKPPVVDLLNGWKSHNEHLRSITSREEAFDVDASQRVTRAAASPPVAPGAPLVGGGGWKSHNASQKAFDFESLNSQSSRSRAETLGETF
jgi:hypothetical protein